MVQVPLKEWCSKGGFILISYPIKLEYSVLNQVLVGLTDEKISLIHSKPIRHSIARNTALIDVTGHELTARSALRRRISDQDDESQTWNPVDTQDFLSRLERVVKKQSQSDWWVWWTPSDLVTHGLEDIEIVPYMRVIASDLSDYRFIILVPEGVHTERGFSILEYIAEVHITSTLKENGKYIWKVIKHYNNEFEGAEVEL